MKWNSNPLKAQTAEEIGEVQTPNGIRKRILEASFHDPLIRRVLDMAKMGGFSGEDTYVFLAYHALVAKQEMDQRMLDDMNTRLPAPFIAKREAP